jgi:hypothetical protein
MTDKLQAAITKGAQADALLRSETLQGAFAGLRRAGFLIVPAA